MNKYFEVVSISEKPGSDDWYFMTGQNAITNIIGWYEYGVGWQNIPSVYTHWLRPLTSLPIDRDTADAKALAEASKNVIETMFWLYTAGNGRKMSIEDSTGEKCWIVPDDAIERLKAVLAAHKESKPSKSLTRDTAEKIWNAGYVRGRADMTGQPFNHHPNKETYLKQFE